MFEEERYLDLEERVRERFCVFVITAAPEADVVAEESVLRNLVQRDVTVSDLIILLV